jgi:hypothetical protein
MKNILHKNFFLVETLNPIKQTPNVKTLFGKFDAK